MKPNSKGSVTPQTKAQMAAERTRPMAAFLFLAALTIARAAPGMPNIMQGKKPDMYMPTLQLAPFWPMTSPAQKWDRSPRPMVSNQKTLLSAWCRPVGMRRRLRKA